MRCELGPLNAEAGRETFSGILGTVWLWPGDVERHTRVDTHFLLFLQVTTQPCKAGESHGDFPLGPCVLPIARKQNSLKWTLHSLENNES